jgi:hypothetical protein
VEGPPQFFQAVVRWNNDAYEAGVHSALPAEPRFARADFQ